MKLNKHGLKITGLKKLAGELQANLPQNNGYRPGRYMQVNYDCNTGEVWADFFYDLGHGSYKKYHDPAIITVCTISQPLTMQGIIDCIASKLNQLEYMENEGFGDGGIYGKATKEFFNRKGQ